ncbi:hypothetical protein IL306_011708, partial [Fusarium sp. DS 682]
NTEAQPKRDILQEAMPVEALLSRNNETQEGHEQDSLDDIATEYGDTSGSERDFASSSDFGSDDEDETTDEYGT